MECSAETEASYYRAIEAAKIVDNNDMDGHSLHYSKETFQDWVKRLDIYNLDKEKADFYVDEEIVTKFSDYRNRVEKELHMHTECDGMKLHGQFRNIGSSQDGSKVGRMNEADSLYIVHAGNIIVKNIGKDGAYRIFWEQNSRDCEIKPRNIRKQFADGYGEVISELPLPRCLRHAGYRSPDYSGLRYNGPAATSQFLIGDNSLLTWDVTPAFPLDCEDTNHQDVRKMIQPALEINRKTMFGDMGIHIIPDPKEDLWMLSTAQLEADLLRELIPSSSPMRQSLSNCKVIASRLQKWNSQNLFHPSA